MATDEAVAYNRQIDIAAQSRNTSRCYLINILNFGRSTFWPNVSVALTDSVIKLANVAALRNGDVFLFVCLFVRLSVICKIC